MKPGARDTAFALGSRVGVLAIGLAIQSTLAWALGPEGRGSYAVCLLFATILGTVFTFGMDRAGQYFAASGRLAVPDSVRAMIAALLAGSALGVAVGWALISLDLPFFAKASRSSFYVSLSVIPFVAVQNAFVMVLIGMRKIGLVAIVTITSVAVQLAAALALVLGLGLGVQGALWSVVIADTVTIAVALGAFRREGWLRAGRVTLSSMGALAGYGVRYYVAKLSTMVHFRVGTLLLAFFVSPAEIGLFAAASQLTGRVTLISKAVEMALFPRVAGDERGRPELVARSGRVTMLAVAAVLCLLVALSWPIVAVVLSPEFLPAVPLIWIVAPGVLARSGANVLMTFYMATNRPAVCSWSVGLGMAANVLAILVLLPRFGLAGAAWAMTIGYVMSWSILLAAFHRSTGRGVVETWRPRRGDVVLLLDGVRQVCSVALRRRPAEGA